MAEEKIIYEGKYRGTAAEMAAMDKTKITAGSTFYARDIKTDYTFENGDWAADKVNVLGPLVQVSTDQTVTYAHSAFVNTQVNVDIAKPTMVKSRYKIIVYNPSTISDLTVKIFNTTLSLGGATRYGFLDSYTVPKSQTITGTTVSTYTKLVEGAFLATDLRLVVSNNTVLGAADGFSAYVRIREAD